MIANKNMDLWNKVNQTDPSITKKVNTRGGFTAICAQSQLKKATETFGSFGLGWGVKDETFQQPITGIILYQATLYYNTEAGKGEFPIHSAAVLCINNKVDDDAVKKVATDALTKGLSKLGFNSDVFEGKFDDNKYVNQMTKTFKPPLSQATKDTLEALLEDDMIDKDIKKKAITWLKKNTSEDDDLKMIDKLQYAKKIQG